MRFPDAEITFFILAVSGILKNNTLFILECALCVHKRNAMLLNIIKIFGFVPIEIRQFHDSIVIQTNYLSIVLGEQTL